MSRHLVSRSILLLVVAGIFAVVVVRAQQSAQPATSAAPSGSARVEAPTSVVAGETLTLTVHMDGGPMPGLLVTTTSTTRLLPAPTDAATGTFVLPPDVTATTGLLTAAPVGYPSAVVDVEIVPGRVVDPLTPLVGPRTIVADAADHTMVTLVALDRLGNPVAAGLRVSVEVRRPDGAIESYWTRTDGLLAWLRVPSGTLAGRTVIGVRLLDARGPAGDVTEVAGPPAVVTLAVEGGVPDADGRSTVTLRTGELRDAFGNLLPDGTHAEVLVEGPDGMSLVPAQVVSGRATAVVAAPDRPATLTFLARVRGVGAAPLDVTFRSAVAELPVVAEVEDGQIVVRVGPVLDPHGGYVADGTRVEVGAPGQTLAVGQLVGGAAMFVLDDDDGGRTVTATVAGSRTTTTVVRR